MTERLHTPWTHKLIVSPLGMLLDTRLFEWIKDRSLPREFRMARTGAAAAATVGEDDGAFLDALGVAPDALDAAVRDRLPAARADFAADWQARAEAIDAWEAAFWGDADVDSDERVAREEARRAASERCITPSGTLGFLAREDAVPPVQCDVPTPVATFETWGDALADPTGLYAAPETLPPVERSHAVPGPAGPEYLVRFDAPSPRMDDTVYARVFEPEGAADAALPTFIYGSGLGMAYDQIRYWPEEDYMGRPLAAGGYRVVLIESPWHGRRVAPGRFSGEPYLATAPVGLFMLYAAQAQETARLIGWAREQGAPVVGVGAWGRQPRRHRRAARGRLERKLARSATPRRRLPRRQLHAHRRGRAAEHHHASTGRRCRRRGRRVDAGAAPQAAPAARSAHHAGPAVRACGRRAGAA
ncbi:MAG: hypothetical protein GVY35_08735 [Bacteroidetes bacterium]|jgi:hypothetical protein|nr:hypothetical protein [Bacteroidota bacterium]